MKAAKENNTTDRGPEAARLRILTTLWFRNTWSWGEHSGKPSVRGWTAVVAPLPDFFGRLDAKTLLESERGHVIARVVNEQVGGPKRTA